MAFVRSTLVELECHIGVSIFSPELSKLFVQAVNINFEVLGEIDEPILTAWGAVQVNNQLEVMVLGPSHGFLQVGQLTLYIGLARTDLECPVA